MSDEGYAKYRGKCKELAEQAVREDPSLRLVRGFYSCPFWGEQQHWWAVGKDGAIVDPTKEQFPSNGTGNYEEVPEGEMKMPCESCGKNLKESEFIVMSNYVVCSNSCAMRLVGL